MSDLIRQSDPLCHEPIWSPQVRQSVRQKVLHDAASVVPLIPLWRQPLAIAMVTMCLGFVVAAAIIPRVWVPLVQAQASVRFEIRLAEDAPAPGLQPANGAGQTIYLHRDPVVGNIDIATARVTSVGPAEFGVDVTFTPSGAEKILRAMRDHVGKPVAMLVDGQVVASPSLKSAIHSSAFINGNFTRSEAERIANGMIGR